MTKLAAAALVALTLAASADAARLSFDRFTIVVPDRWHSRALPGMHGKAIWVSNASLRRPAGTDPILTMAPGTFVLTLIPLGSYGSPHIARITRSDFLASNYPARPRGRAAAGSWYCSAAGPCLSISLLYRRPPLPDDLLLQINKALRTLRAA
jgi:hypothetical protein